MVVIIGNRDLAIQHFAEQQADGLRGARYVDFEAGAVAQNMYLAVTAQGLGSVVVMGFDDGAMKRALELDETRQPVALSALANRQFDRQTEHRHSTDSDFSTQAGASS